MQATKFQQQLVRVMAQIYAGIYVDTADKTITKADLEKIAYGWNTVVATTLPRTGVDRTYYFIKGTNASAGNAYDTYIWVQDADGVFKFEKIGQVAYDMKDHYTAAQFEELLAGYRDIADPVPVLASKYADDIGFVQIDYGAFKLTVKSSNYSIFDPLKAVEGELNNFYNNVETLSALDFNACMDKTIAVVNNALN